MSNLLYVYATNPIDFWFGWQTVEQAVQSQKQFIDGDTGVVGAELDCCVRKARLAVEEHPCFEADGLSFTRVAGIPRAESDGDGRDVFVAFKISNNGTTFIVSPIRLPWLEDDEYPAFQVEVMVRPVTPNSDRLHIVASTPKGDIQ